MHPDKNIVAVSCGANHALFMGWSMSASHLYLLGSTRLASFTSDPLDSAVEARAERFEQQLAAEEAATATAAATAVTSASWRTTLHDGPAFVTLQS